MEKGTESNTAGVHNSSKVRVLLLALREATAIVLAALEDYLDVAYDKSALAKRRAKCKEI